MAKRRAKDEHLIELAKRGAETQLNDLLHEARMLLDLFPHLRDAYDPDELPVSFLLKRASDRAQKKAERHASGSARTRAWTAAKRRAAAARMKAYWAKRRKKKEE